MVTASVDYLPLLAEFEIYGARTNANTYEKNYQKQYAYYSAGNSKVKYRHSATSSTAYWRTRSPYYGNTTYFCSASTSGATVGSTYARLSYGLAPIFRVGAELIHFTVNTNYAWGYALPGMTWREFINSEYNDGSYTSYVNDMNQEAVLINNGTYQIGEAVLDDVIVSGRDYYYEPPSRSEAE